MLLSMDMNKFSEVCGSIISFFLPQPDHHVMLNLTGFHYFLIRFTQTKTTLFIFFNNWVSKGKQKFSASRAVFSCNTLRGNKVTIFLL